MKRKLELAMAALADLCRLTPQPNQTEAMKKFLTHADKDADTPKTAKNPEAALKSAEPNLEQLNLKLDQLIAEKNKAEEAKNAAEGLLQEKNKEISNLKGSNAELKGSNDELKRQVQEAQSKARQAEQTKAELLSLFKDDEFESLKAHKKLMDAICHDPTGKRLIAPFYALEDVSTFLVCCGQFQRLSQCFEKVGQEIYQGAQAGKLAVYLEELTKLYNLASNDSPAKLLMVSAGDPYDSAKHARVDSDGQSVAEFLLPGLYNPGGKLVHKAFVVLK